MSIINSRIKPFNATAYHNGRFVLVSDPTQAISRNFDVLVEEEGMALRGTFVVDPAGEIKLCEIHDNGIGRDAVTPKAPRPPIVPHWN